MKRISFALFISLVFTISSFGVETLEVYKSPSCGCCGSWEKIMQKNGFKTTEYKTDAILEVKTKYKVPLELSSCHTAVIDGYVIEGHVPADEIKRLLSLKPANAVGLSVPGMPLESPGMEQGSKPEKYDVVLFNKDGSTEVFATYIGSKKIK